MNDQKGSDLLMGLLEDLTVEDLDAKLNKLGKEWRRTYAIRILVATEQGVRTPPPRPPTVDTLETTVSVQPVSKLTWGQLVDHFKADPNSPYNNVKFSTRTFYGGLSKRLIQELGDTKLSDFDGDKILQAFEGWKATGKVPMAKALVGMARSLVNFGRQSLNDPECHRLAVPLHRMREINLREPAQTAVLTEGEVKAIIKKAHEMEFHSIAFAQALQFSCSFGQKDVIGEWIPISEPGESDIVQGGKKWVRGLRWSNIYHRDLRLRHRVGRALKEVEIDLRTAPLVQDELDRYQPWPTSGAVIKSEANDLPYFGVQFRRNWRQVADAVGIPKNLTNTDTPSRDDDSEGEV